MSESKNKSIAVKVAEYPPLIFLGIAERASIESDLGSPFLKWNILGLKQNLLVNFLPLDISILNWVLGINATQVLSGPIEIRILSPTAEEVGKVTINSQVATDPKELEEVEAVQRVGPVSMMPQAGWAISAAPLGGTTILAKEAGKYRIVWQKNDTSEEILGEFEIIQFDVPPLSPEVIQAIKSDPKAARFARAQVKCKKCPSEVKFYTGIEKSHKSEKEGFLWYADIPDEFVCECGSTQIDLTTFRRNFHGVLGRHLLNQEGLIQFDRLYQSSTLHDIRLKFLNLLNEDPKEEEIQKFINENPIILHQFPAEKLFIKPSIMNKFKADFGIVTPQRELLLIELERANMRLLKKDGGETAGIQHAIGQVTDWLHVVDEHRLAILDDLGIDRKLASTVKGVVIGGRDGEYDPDRLRKMKGIDRGRVIFLTYDDIASSLLRLAQRMATF